MNTILFGFKGCGKSHLGKLLAMQLGCPFVDTDHLICDWYYAETGMQAQIGEIYRSLGSEAFRAAERKVIAQLTSLKNSIIAVGGGAVMCSENLSMLSNMGTLIYLEANLDTLHQRSVSHPEGTLEEVYAKRMPYYRSIPAPCIMVKGLTEEEIITKINEIIKEKAPYGL